MSNERVLNGVILVLGLLLGMVVEAKIFAPLTESDMQLPRSGKRVHMVAASEKEGADTNRVGGDVPESVAPKLSVPSSKYNFGRRERGEIVRNTFTLRNTGGSPLKLGEIKPACGCTAAEPSQSVISPGEEATLDVTLNLSKQEGHQHKSIAVESNDPNNPVYQLTMVGTATSRVQTTPDRVEMGQVPAAKPTTKMVDVKATEGLMVKVQNVKTSGADISADYEVVEPGKAWRVRVKLDPLVEQGLVRGWVQLVTDHSGEYRVIGIPVSARVGGAATAPQAKLAE